MKQEFFLKAPSTAESAYVDESELPDPTVGSIVYGLECKEGDIDDDIDDSVNRTAEQKRTYVYRSRKFGGKPYYFTRMGTKVLVVDHNRIDYFPSGAEPPELASTLKDYKPLSVKETACFGAEPYDAWKAAQQRKADLANFYKMPKCVGSILVQQHKQNGVLGEVEVTRRDVYCSEYAFSGVPFFYTHNGSKILVMNNKKIEYIKDKNSADSGTNECLNSSRASRVPHMIEDSTSDSQNDGSFGDDVLLGTVLMRVGKGAHGELSRVPFHVFGTPPVSGTLAFKKRPYVVADSGKRIPVSNVESIKVLPKWMEVHIDATVKEEEPDEDESPVRIGTIKVSKGASEELNDVDVRSVYSFKRKLNGQPFYYSHGGSKVMVLDKNRIQTSAGESCGAPYQ